MGKARRTAKGNTGGAAWRDKRKYLTGGEVQKLIDAVARSRNPARDHCLLLLATVPPAPHGNLPQLN